MSPQKPFAEESVLEETGVEEGHPSMYKVLLHNDDYTSMDFVVHVLERVFKKAHDEAVQIMWSVHLKGMGLCGVYTREIAETKVATVHQLARRSGFPLKCSLEPE
ncbi:MAG: ATP-dependent Clp protease adapter ClpS [Desulfatibacillaceae bacterium]|nr:ATP-dependent Clp protease adapter ClpS [Desulfatibacillaceae bacterium]